MKRFITNQPSRQNVRKIKRLNGIYKPYGLNDPAGVGGRIDPRMMQQCLEAEGWTPDTSDPNAWYFGQVDAWLTRQQAETCSLDHLPGSLRNDVERCLRAQGGCQ